jgi:polysaccharide deacetylase family protein (PEP-CTERM system associated)
MVKGYARPLLAWAFSLWRKEIVRVGRPDRQILELAFEVRTTGTIISSRPISLATTHILSTSHFFTVDVEEYFQVKALESVVRRDDWLSRPSRVAPSIDALLESLDRRGARGTFFVLGWLAEHRPEVVLNIAAAGHEIASHGYWHERVTTLDADAFREDIRSSKHALEDLTGTAVLGYRAPNFSIIPGWEWAFDCLIEEGYAYDSSLFPFRRRGYGYPGAQRAPHVIQRASGRIAEFPLATTSIFGYSVPAAGGGYLRHLPLVVVQRAFREASARREPATFYIHPWEIDAGQPRLPVSALNRVRHYRGLGGTLGRIERLLDEFRFDTIASHLTRMDGLEAPLAAAGAA